MSTARRTRKKTTGRLPFNNTKPTVWRPEDSSLPTTGFTTRVEAARFLQTSTRAIDRMIGEEKVDSIKIGGARWVRCESLWRIAKEGT